MSFEHKARELVSHFRTIMERDRGVDKNNADLREVMSCQEAQVLWKVGDGGPVTMTDIADSVHLSLSSVTGIVDKLERKKFVRRGRSADDRRIVRVEITEAGRQAHKLVEEGHLQVTRDILRALSAKEQDHLLELFRKISTKLKEHAALFLILGFVAIAAPVRAAATPEPETSTVTLQQCFEWARARSESLKIRQEDIAQSELRARSSLSGALPDVSWEWRDTYQDPDGVETLERRGFSGFVQKNQIESNFSARQPLFGGLKEYSARSGFLRERARNALLMQRAQRELFERTAVAFYTVLAHETDWENTDAALTLSQDRVKELRSFLRLGKARDSEVFAAQAQASALEAQLRQIRARIISAREDLSFLTGRNLSEAPLADEIPELPAPGPIEQSLEQARGRSDLQAQREDAAGRKLRIRYEKGFYWPTAALTGRYYTQRATFLEEIKWDVQLSLRVPLYQGGSVWANVRQAESAYRQSLLALDELERRISSSVRKTHGELLGALEETQSLQSAAEAAFKSYEALRKESRLGLVTNLELIQALDLLQSQRRARDSARLKAKMLYLQLNVATEKLPEGIR